MEPVIGWFVCQSELSPPLRTAALRGRWEGRGPDLSRFDWTKRLSFTPTRLRLLVNLPVGGNAAELPTRSDWPSRNATQTTAPPPSAAAPHLTGRAGEWAGLSPRSRPSAGNAALSLAAPAARQRSAGGGRASSRPGLAVRRRPAAGVPWGGGARCPRRCCWPRPAWPVRRRGQGGSEVGGR